MTGKFAKHKRRYVARPGLKESAALLGVSYGHLRLCVIGQRRSDSLLRRLHALHSRQGADPASDSEFPAETSDRRELNQTTKMKGKQ